MRRFTATDGSRWDAVAGRESWGASVVLFVSAGDDAVRQVTLDAPTVEAASARIDAMSEVELQELLNKSTQKELS